MIEYERLLKIAKKMHLWIFLNCGDEKGVYDELGLTPEENKTLGYSGKIEIGSDKDAQKRNISKNKKNTDRRI